MRLGRRLGSWFGLGPLYLPFVIAQLSVVLLLHGMLRWGVVTDEALVLDLATLLVYLALAWHAVARALCNVPLVRPGYRAWLATTPWTINAPLPFGPIGLDWPDVVILGAIVAVNGTIPGHQSARLLAVFFFLHALAMVPIIYRAVNHVPAYLALFGLGTMIGLWPRPWAGAATGAVVYLIVLDGMRRTLAGFPEPGDEKPPASHSNFDPETAPRGWPHDALLRDLDAAEEGGRPRRITAADVVIDGRWASILMNRGVPVVDVVAWSLLAGWWAFCVGAILPPGTAFHVLASLTLAEVGIGYRFLGYAMGYVSPLSCWGRLVTLRWIIPGYDVVAVAPALAMATPAAIWFVGLSNGFPPEIVGPTAIAATLFVALAAPPGYRRWRLVGRHRMIRVRSNKRSERR